MALEQTRGSNYNLVRLLEGVADGDVALPEFQRDFVWTREQVRQLLGTVLTGWPLGSLLLLPGARQRIFSVRELAGAPKLRRDPSMVVLDGQQRLTGLYRALYDVGDAVFAVAFRELANQKLAPDALDDFISAYDRSTWDRNFDTPQRQFDAGLVPVSVLREAADFFDWRDSIGDLEADERELLGDLFRTRLSGLHRYEVPAVVMTDSIPPSQIAKIFERVNRAGQPLTTFDLMVAMTYGKAFNLRSKWRESSDSDSFLSSFLEDDGLPVLAGIALVERSDIRQTAILELSRVVVERRWDAAIAASSSAARFLVEHAGVWARAWLPYPAMLTVLTALSAEGVNLGAPQVLNWFWRTSLERRYDVASNTRAVADFAELVAGRWEIHPMRPGFNATLECTKKSNGALHRAISITIAQRRPLDPADGLDLFPRTDAELAHPDVEMRSLFARGVQIDSEVGSSPPHLRSLGMVLTRKRSVLGFTGRVDNALITALASQLAWPSMPGLRALPEPRGFFFARMDNLRNQWSILGGAEVEFLDD